LAWRIVFSLFAGLCFLVVALVVIILAKAMSGTGALDRQKLIELVLVYVPVVGWSFFVLIVCRHKLREFRQANR
jgi:hypothetical protein